MAPRYQKHDHVFRIISHTPDRARVLVMCKTCPETEVMTRTSKRVKIADRKYRPQTNEEYADMLRAMEHLCCA